MTFIKLEFLTDILIEYLIIEQQHLIKHTPTQSQDIKYNKSQYINQNNSNIANTNSKNIIISENKKKNSSLLNYTKESRLKIKTFLSNFIQFSFMTISEKSRLIEFLINNLPISIDELITRLSKETIYDLFISELGVFILRKKYCSIVNDCYYGISSSNKCNCRNERNVNSNNNTSNINSIKCNNYRCGGSYDEMCNTNTNIINNNSTCISSQNKYLPNSVNVDFAKLSSLSIINQTPNVSLLNLTNIQNPYNNYNSYLPAFPIKNQFDFSNKFKQVFLVSDLDLLNIYSLFSSNLFILNGNLNSASNNNNDLNNNIRNAFSFTSEAFLLISLMGLSLESKKFNEFIESYNDELFIMSYGNNEMKIQHFSNNNKSQEINNDNNKDNNNNDKGLFYTFESVISMNKVKDLCYFLGLNEKSTLIYLEKFINSNSNCSNINSNCEDSERSENNNKNNIKAINIIDAEENMYLTKEQFDVFMNALSKFYDENFSESSDVLNNNNNHLVINKVNKSSNDRKIPNKSSNTTKIADTSMPNTHNHINIKNMANSNKSNVNVTMQSNNGDLKNMQYNLNQISSAKKKLSYFTAKSYINNITSNSMSSNNNASTNNNLKNNDININRLNSAINSNTNHIINNSIYNNNQRNNNSNNKNNFNNVLNKRKNNSNVGNYHQQELNKEGNSPSNYKKNNNNKYSINNNTNSSIYSINSNANVNKKIKYNNASGIGNNNQNKPNTTSSNKINNKRTTSNNNNNYSTNRINLLSQQSNQYHTNIPTENNELNNPPIYKSNKV